MGIGIMMCGLNGCGKSTLGKALAEALKFRFIDNENLYFRRSLENDPYEKPRAREEVIDLLMGEVREYGSFVFTAVKGDYGEEILPLFDCVVVIEVPRELRLQRVRDRSFQKYGERMLPGGDMYAQEEAFLRAVETRPEDFVDKWTRTLNAPIIRVDGTRPICENVALLVDSLCGLGLLG